MIIEQYGVKLKRLTINDIEMVRNWRNSPEIRIKMAYKRYITPKMQKEWFQNIDNKYNYYFLIEYKNRNIGVVNAKNINLKEMYGEGGIFVWDNSNDVELGGVFASLTLLNFVFIQLNCFNKSFIQILKSNHRAIHFNKSLGYFLLPFQQNQQNQYYLLTKEDYLIKTEKLTQIASKLSNDFELPRVYGLKSEKNLDSINELISPQ